MSANVSKDWLEDMRVGIRVRPGWGWFWPLMNISDCMVASNAGMTVAASATSMSVLSPEEVRGYMKWCVRWCIRGGLVCKGVWASIWKGVWGCSHAFSAYSFTHPYPFEPNALVCWQNHVDRLRRGWAHPFRRWNRQVSAQRDQKGVNCQLIEMKKPKLALDFHPGLQG